MLVYGSSSHRNCSRPLALIRKSATSAADIPSSNAIFCTIHIDQRQYLAGECGACGACDDKGKQLHFCPAESQLNVNAKGREPGRRWKPRSSPLQFSCFFASAGPSTSSSATSCGRVSYVVRKPTSFAIEDARSSTSAANRFASVRA